jgi:hypothetical protein
MTKHCLVCNKEFEKPYTCSIKYWNEISKYCSRECQHKSIRSKETRKKMSLAKKNYIPWNKGISPSLETREKIRQATLKQFENGMPIETRLKIGGHVPWNKGLGVKLPFRKESPEYRNWRTQVFKRDNYTCIECGQRGVRLQAHHIKPKGLFPELILDVDNGATLCVDCHKATDNYGYKTALEMYKLGLVARIN